MELDIEREASDKDLYKYDPKERKDKKDYRHKKIAQNIERRMKALSEYTGMKFFNISIEKLHRKALIKYLEKKGLFSEGEYLDIYYLVADEDIRKFEAKKEDLKKQALNKKVNSKILTPGAVKFRRPIKTVRS